jgi:hypothetical protein
VRAVLTVAAVAALAFPATASAARTYAPCQSPDGSGIELKYQPRKCILGGPIHYQQAPLVKLRWRTWSGAGARGRGRFIYNMGFNKPATVRLFRRRSYDDDRYVFTRGRVCVRGHGCHKIRLPWK